MQCFSVQKVHLHMKKLLLLFAVVTGVLLLAEQLGGAVVPTEQGPSPAPPALFGEVGPSVDDWEKYLRNVAEDLDKRSGTSTEASSIPTRQEDKLFLQVDPGIL